MPEKINKVFIDADAFVSLIDLNDSQYEKSVKINRYLEKTKTEVFTSNMALGEAITVISQNAGHELAVAFGNKVFQSEIIVIDANRNQELTALNNFAKAKSKNVRFTDFVNIAIMEELGISAIFSFDKHYKQAGFTLLLSTID